MKTFVFLVSQLYYFKSLSWNWKLRISLNLTKNCKVIDFNNSVNIDEAYHKIANKSKNWKEAKVKSDHWSDIET